MILNALRDDRIVASDRLTAVGLAADITVVNDELVEALLSILGDAAASDELRGRAAISLGPALEYAEYPDVPNFHALTAGRLYAEKL